MIDLRRPYGMLEALCLGLAVVGSAAYCAYLPWITGILESFGSDVPFPTYLSMRSLWFYRAMCLGSTMVLALWVCRLDAPLRQRVPARFKAHKARTLGLITLALCLLYFLTFASFFLPQFQGTLAE